MPVLLRSKVAKAQSDKVRVSNRSRLETAKDVVGYGYLIDTLE